MNKTLLTITGSSASGKTYLCEELLKRQICTKLVTTTTRSPRIGEINGKHYHFINPEDFDKSEFIEHVNFSNHLYGIRTKDFDVAFETKKPVVAIVEPRGMHAMTKYCDNNKINVVTILVKPKIDVIIRRFITRMLEEIQASSNINPIIESYTARMTNLISEEIVWFERYENLADVIIDDVDLGPQIDKILHLINHPA